MTITVFLFSLLRIYMAKRTFRRRRKMRPQPKRSTNVTMHNIAPVVKQILNRRQENKFVNNICPNEPTVFGGAIDSISPVAQGDTEGNRQGLVINATSLDFTFDIYRDQTPGTQQNFVRVIVFQWKDPDSFPLPANVLNFAPTVACPEQNYQAQYQMVQYKKTARIYMDRTYSVTDQVQTHHIHKKIKLNNLKIEYIDGTLGSQSNKSLYVLYLAGGNVAAQTNLPFIQYNYQLNFNDT